MKFHHVVEHLRVRRDGVEEIWMPPGTGPEAELLGLLKLARTRLVDAVGPRPRAAGPGGLVRAAAGYVSLHDSRRRGHRISTAERCLCQAIAATERWQAAVRDPR